MIKFLKVTPYGRDCTCGYELELDKEYSVRQFINTILMDRPNEWGYIGINSKQDIFGSPNCMYRGVEITTSQFTDTILESNIVSVSASGGYSRMDYLINLK